MRITAASRAFLQSLTPSPRSFRGGLGCSGSAGEHGGIRRLVVVCEHADGLREILRFARGVSLSARARRGRRLHRVAENRAPVVPAERQRHRGGTLLVGRRIGRDHRPRARADRVGAPAQYSGLARGVGPDVRAPAHRPRAVWFHRGGWRVRRHTLNETVARTIATHFYAPCFYAMVALHPIAWLLLRHFA